MVCQCEGGTANTNTYTCKHAYTHSAATKEQVSNLSLQQDQAGLVRQRLHEGETDAVEKYCSSSPETVPGFMCYDSKRDDDICFKIDI